MTDYHITETCVENTPDLITHVETTPGSTADRDVTPTPHRALEDKDLLPSIHSADTDCDEPAGVRNGSARPNTR